MKKFKILIYLTVFILFSCTTFKVNLAFKLLGLYDENINLLPFSWREMIKDDVNNSEMSIIADYIAGMTDRYAIKQYQSF